MGLFRSTIKPKIAFIASRISRRIWSRETWLVFAFDLTHHDTKPDDESDTQDDGDVQVRSIEYSDLNDICAVYPTEFRWAMTDAEVNHTIEASLRANIPGFVARSREGSVLGAVWCYDSRLSKMRDFSSDPDIRWFEMVNAFVVPAARGRNVYGFIDRMARAAMKEANYNLALAQVRIDRYPMIKVSLRLGYRMIGTRTMLTRCGKRTWHTAVILN